MANKLFTISFIIVYLIIAIVIVLFPRIGKEDFVCNYVKMDNAEFRGINLLGLNSSDAHFAADSEQVCGSVCARNPECRGYSWYQPGQRCYMFSSGDFVANRPGYRSGKKAH